MYLIFFKKNLFITIDELVCCNWYTIKMMSILNLCKHNIIPIIICHLNKLWNLLYL